MNIPSRNFSNVAARIAASLFALGSTVGAVSSASAASLTVEIKGAVGDKGTVKVALYTKGDPWLGKPSAGRSAEAKKADLVFVFDDLTEGEYAISMFIDENNNGKLDRNMIGIPTEPSIFSNDATGNFGPPTFDQAKFTVGKEKKSIAINLK